MPHEMRHRPERVLALEVRPQKFGFAVFDGSTRLMDWGVRSSIDRRHRRRVTAQNAIRRLLDIYGPSVVVMRQRKNHSTTAHAMPATEVIIRGEARRRSIKCRTVSARNLGRFYSRLGCTTKHEIASLIAEWFEELSWNVPPKRKAWQPEHYQTAVFDAAALGVFFLSKNESIAA